MKNSLVVGLVVGAVALLGVAVHGLTVRPVAVTVVQAQPAGATAGPEFSETQRFLQGFTWLDDSWATSSANSSESLTTSNLLTYCSFVETPTVQSMTLKPLASSSLTAFVPRQGERSCRYFINNSTTTAGVTLTLAGNTGVMVLQASSSISQLVMQPGQSAFVTFIRATSSRDILMVVEPVK